MALWKRNQDHEAAAATDLSARDEIRVRRDDDLAIRRDDDLGQYDATATTGNELGAYGSTPNTYEDRRDTYDGGPDTYDGSTTTDDDLFVRRGVPTDTAPTTPPVVTPAVTPTAVHTEIVDRPVLVRGGIALWAVVTGAVTALGGMMLFAAIAAGIAATQGVESTALNADISDYSWAALAFVFGQFFAYLWGGYTAGRMARGMGALNGLLVPIMTLGIGAAVIAIADALGASVNLNMPFMGDANLSVNDASLTTSGALMGIAILVAMLAGGIYGGILGARWHRRLEDPTARPHGRRVAD